MSSEKFCLKWNDFESNITTAFRELREEEDFFDVTLACEDNQIEAHKVILSACSPFFRNILKRNPHQHPLLYLKGVKYRELINIVAFIYRGEVSVSQEDLNSFLAVAEELHVKGLTQSEGSSSSRGKAKTNPGKRPGDGGRGYGEPSKRAKHQQEDGDTEEVMQVKSEPMLHGRDTSTEIFDETQDYDYEGYDDGTNSVEQTSSYTSGLDKGKSGRVKRGQNVINIKRDLMVSVGQAKQCSICQRIFSSEYKAIDHILEVHREIRRKN